MKTLKVLALCAVVFGMASCGNSNKESADTVATDTEVVGDIVEMPESDSDTTVIATGDGEAVVVDSAK